MNSTKQERFGHKNKQYSEVIKVKLYQNKEKPWKWIATRKEHYEKNFFFYLRKPPTKHWLKRFKYTAHINLFFVSFWRDMSNLKFGVGLGKLQYSLIFHK